MVLVATAVAEVKLEKMDDIIPEAVAEPLDI
jgi:hypothetical protein